MTRRLVVTGLGSRVAIELLDGAAGPQADAELWARIRHAWARATVAGDQADDTVRVRLGGERGQEVRSTGSADQILQGLTQDVTHALIQQRAGDLLMLHAGAVSHPTTGATLVYAAPSGTGKSTLTRRLGREWAYLTDECVGIVPDSDVVLPYQKPISTRVDKPGPKQELSPNDLELALPGATPRVTKLVVLDRQPQAVGFTATDLSSIEAMEGLINETSSLSRLPHALHLLDDLLHRTGGAQRWTYAENETLVGAVADVLGMP